MTGEANASGFDVSVDVSLSMDVDVSVVESVPVSLEVSVVVGPQETKTSKAPKTTERKRLLIIVNPF
jgi:hypothetical protein